MRLLGYVAVTSSADSFTNMTPSEFANPTRFDTLQGFVVRVDPSSRRIVRRVRVGRHPRGLVSDATAI
jgi:hypothetical protein